jgi:hypothetical protein
MNIEVQKFINNENDNVQKPKKHKGMIVNQSQEELNK